MGLVPRVSWIELLFRLRFQPHGHPIANDAVTPGPSGAPLSILSSVATFLLVFLSGDRDKAQMTVVALVAVGAWPLFNKLGLAYLVPALLAARFAMTATERGQVRLAGIVGGAALVFGFVYLSLEVTRGFRGSVLSAAELGDGEMYCYSAVWLLYGIALLALGLWLGLASLRYAALAMVGLTILKVFLYDMAALAGVLRVLSFLGLGLSLLGLAWVYQRFVLGAARKSVASPT